MNMLCIRKRWKTCCEGSVTFALWRLEPGMQGSGGFGSTNDKRSTRFTLIVCAALRLL